MRLSLRPWHGLLLGIGCLMILTGCRQTQSLERSLTPPSEYTSLDSDSPFLKAHLTDGDVVVFSSWTVAAADERIEGRGHRLGVNRDTLARGPMQVAIDEVALFETNRTQPSGSVAALSIITGASLALTGYCAANPKACFGSCPTFYAPAGPDTLLQAEGFSSSIAPSLERTDVDALSRTTARGSTLDLRMTNEALETHVVRQANLLVAPRPDGGRVLRTPEGTFWAARALQPPTRCTAPEGDCRAAVRAHDGTERFSRADSTDLATKETITLTFDARPARAGLVLSARQTLMTTYLLYQTLAYMGHDAGRWLAMLERNDARLRAPKVKNLLGGIEVWAPTGAGGWTKVGEAGEHGPLATDTYVVPLPDRPAGATTLRLRLTKGNWRLDHLALADLEAPITPTRVRPTMVRRDGAPAPEGLASLRDPTETLVTLPGDAYTLSYDLPDDTTAYEVFLESRGYYLEWIRDAWLAETDPDRVAAMLFEPEQMMKTLAPAFKAAEPHLEDAFWNSRYER
ncbi:MAG: hypothetical protein GVY35_13590 [Bacteroidetes bacterium]|jgi:hypothetical protein|nr:hypothetical protein [Bacteroidota bacterium]